MKLQEHLRERVWWSCEVAESTSGRELGRVVKLREGAWRSCEVGGEELWESAERR